VLPGNGEHLYYKEHGPMAQPQHIDLTSDLDSSRVRVRRILREMEELNRELARVQERLETAERRHAEVVEAAYGIHIERKEPNG
jgi:hypothetical protein